MGCFHVRIAIALLVAASWPALSRAESFRVPLATGWTIQSSAAVNATGAAVSQPDFSTSGWHTAAVPGTVVGALVDEGTFKDPYFGMNFRNIPGTTYRIGEEFSLLPIPAGSPYKRSWWYRKEFELPATGLPVVWLNFNGINYRANIWVNGARIATRDEVAGAFRRYEFDITRLVRRGTANAVAVEVFAPEPGDLAITWVDWNPTPPDKNMGLWGDAYVEASGPVAIRHPHVITNLDLPSLDVAHLTVTADVWNATDAPVDAVVRGTIESIQFSRPLTLAPREHKTIRFSPADTPQLNIQHPRIWWPYRMGDQPQYSLSIAAGTDGAESDSRQVTFGINEYSSELTDKGHRLFRVNGKPILIRGGGWASDMLLRPKSPERLAAEFRYVKEMGLNTIRTEGKLETDAFYELADREGILIMPGWCCCDQWELWDKWDAEDYTVGPASLRDQLLRLRNHPSIFVWMNGSDGPPIGAVEQKYLDIERELEWSRPILSSGAEAAGPVSGPSGVKMRGPYDYVPPSYWLTDTAHGGAFGFSTEIGPGAAVPPVESLKQMLPPDHLWPIDRVWNFHAGGEQFKNIKLFTSALEARYGKAIDVDDYARKAQALTYEGQRAMFEGYARNKYTATGVIQWMLNNAWPSIIWHLYDYYLRPGGGYFGTKIACEPVHVQYSYDDRSIVVVNDTQNDLRDLKVTATLLDFNLAEKFTREAPVDVAPDAVRRVFEVPATAGLTPTYFLRLALLDRDGRLVSGNFYWLSTQEDQLDWAKTQWYTTPTKRHADLTALSRLPPTTVTVSSTPQSPEGAPSDFGAMRVIVANTGPALAFQVRLKAVDPETGAELLPAFWDDNYFELMPGERREVRVSYPRGQRGVPPRVTAEGWNTSGK
jgi:exo-1,4-beta-D-glucosaminidase